MCDEGPVAQRHSWGKGVLGGARRRVIWTPRRRRYRDHTALLEKWQWHEVSPAHSRTETLWNMVSLKSQVPRLGRGLKPWPPTGQ